MQIPKMQMLGTKPYNVDPCKTRQSVAVQRDGASRLAKKIPIIALPKCILDYFYSKK